MTSVPTPKRHVPKRRFIPDRPSGGYHVGAFAPETTPLAHLDHVAEIRQAIAQLERDDDVIEQLIERIDRIDAKLADPVLLKEIPIDDPRRLEAEDLRDDLIAKATEHTWSVRQVTGRIGTHAGYLIAQGREEDVDAIGRELVHGHGALGRVQVEDNGFLTLGPWQRLLAAACPF